MLPTNWQTSTATFSAIAIGTARILSDREWWLERH